jgi:uncharacterized protein (TIGR04255 family)
MRSPDGKWIVSLMPDFLSLETTAYTTWGKDFRVRLNEVLSAVGNSVKIGIVERTGLRYVNRLTEHGPDTTPKWNGAVVDSLLGPIADSYWASGVDNFQAQLDLDLDRDRRCIFRHGLIAGDGDGNRGYLLDFDIYRQVPGRFDADVVMEEMNAFNKAAITLFHKSITPAYLSFLRGE